jgi:hypothetical protein
MQALWEQVRQCWGCECEIPFSYASFIDFLIAGCSGTCGFRALEHRLPYTGSACGGEIFAHQNRAQAMRCNMKVATRFVILLAALFLLSAGCVKADSGQCVNYTLSGPTSASFTITMDAAPAFSGPGYYFTASPANLIVGGTSMSDMIVFFSSADLGGLNSVFSNLPDLSGAQLYSGSESDPTLLTGVFELWNLDGGGWYTLTATSASATVPEPSILLMLVAGLLFVGVGFKRRAAQSADFN